MLAGVLLHEVEAAIPIHLPFHLIHLKRAGEHVDDSTVPLPLDDV